jgi:hypothetical protein
MKNVEDDTDRKDLIKRHLSLLDRSNRANDNDYNSKIYHERNDSGMMCHAVFIQAFVWEKYRDDWYLEERQAINDGTPLIFLRSLLIKSLILDVSSSHNTINNSSNQNDDLLYDSPKLIKHPTYLWDLKEGDLIKLAIISQQFMRYSPFNHNDGVYIIRFNSNTCMMDLYPLAYNEECRGHIPHQIEFDGKRTRPDCYTGFLAGDNVCWPSTRIKELFISSIDIEILYDKDSQDKNRTYYMCSYFKYNNMNYRFFMPCPRSAKKHTRVSLTAFLNESFNNNPMSCVYYPDEEMDSRETYNFEMTTDIFEMHQRLNTRTIYNTIQTYLEDHQVPVNQKKIIDLRKSIENADDLISINHILRDCQEENNLRKSPMQAVQKYATRFSDISSTQFVFEEICAYGHTSP